MEQSPAGNRSSAIWRVHTAVTATRASEAAPVETLSRALINIIQATRADTVARLPATEHVIRRVDAPVQAMRLTQPPAAPKKERGQI